MGVTEKPEENNPITDTALRGTPPAGTRVRTEKTHTEASAGGSTCAAEQDVVSSTSERTSKAGSAGLTPPRLGAHRPRSTDGQIKRIKYIRTHTPPSAH